MLNSESNKKMYLSSVNRFRTDAPTGRLIFFINRTKSTNLIARFIAMTDVTQAN